LDPAATAGHISGGSRIVGRETRKAFDELVVTHDGETAASFSESGLFPFGAIILLFLLSAANEQTGRRSNALSARG
jgi:hypothetical protein